MTTVGFAGLTHLGLVSAVATASKGFNVVGYDDDGARVAAICSGKLPVVEPDLDALTAANAQRLTWSDRVQDLGRCDLVYIAPDVPTDDDGRSDLSGIAALIQRVIAILKPTAVLVVLCQVPPGFTRKLPLEPERLYYQVETLVFGRAVERATQPERFIVGGADAGKPLPTDYAALLHAFGCPILPMRYESAELAKIAINCCLVASVSVANTLAEVSEGVGADWHEIVPALRLDRRIGPYSYLVPGLGIAGGNLERDLATVLRLSEEIGSDASVITSFLVNSRHRCDWALRTLHREVLAVKPGATLGVLGLAYKENTHSVKNSPSLELISHIRHLPVRLFDPVVPASAAGHPTAIAATDALDAARGVDSLLLMTPWPAFKQVAPAQLAAAMAGRVVIDPYRLMDPNKIRAVGLRHFSLGAPGQEA